MFRREPMDLRATLEQLERAQRDHAEWRAGLLRSIVCRQSPDPLEARADAHRVCRFGRWYYELAADVLRERPAFVALEYPHREAHRAAARMLARTAQGGPVACDDFDALMASSRQLGRSLDDLRHDLETALGRCDPLTGAHGRVELLPELDEWRAVAQRHVEPTSIVFMDVDHLKEINDRHGHAVGDQVLAGAVRYVEEHLRPYDRIFRYGGDEFVISLPGTSLADALHLVERIRTGLGRVPFVTSASGEEIYATASFGVAMLDGEVRAEQSIDRADKALLQAKINGRNRVVGWEPTIATGTRLNWGAP